jgi:hypothetical protein
MPTIDPDSTGFIERRAPNGHYRWAADGQLAELLLYLAHHPGSGCWLTRNWWRSELPAARNGGLCRVTDQLTNRILGRLLTCAQGERVVDRVATIG